LIVVQKPKIKDGAEVKEFVRGRRRKINIVWIEAVQRKS
jgi:hypothetical protein